MSDDEGRREKKRRRKQSRKNKEAAAVSVSNDDSENKVSTVDDPDDQPTPSSNVIKPEGRNDEVEKQQEEENNNTPAENTEEATPAKRKRKRKRKSKQVASAASAANQNNHADKDTDERTKKLSCLEFTVYVEGIPFDCTEDDVRDFFVSNDCSDVLQLRLPRWQDSGRLRGYGHVVFDSVDSRTRAIETLNGKTLGTRYMTIQAPRAPRADTTMGAMESRQVRQQPQGCNTVYAKNLPWDATEEEIRDVFQVCGKILDGGVRIARNYQTRESKGFAYVEFKNPEGAQAAVNKAAKPFGMTVKGRPCFVDYDEGSMKGSFKTADGRLWSRQYGNHDTAGGRKPKQQRHEHHHQQQQHNAGK